jgi:hypothetical protein
MSSAEQQLSANLPAPKTFAPSREDVLSTLGFFFGDPGTRSRPLEPKGHGTLCVRKLSSRSDLCLARVRRVSFVTAVPEKLKDYSEHHAMYAPRRKRPVCGRARLYCIKKLTRKCARFFSTRRTYHFPDGAHRCSAADTHAPTHTSTYADAPTHRLTRAVVSRRASSSSSLLWPEHVRAVHLE